MVGCNRCGRPLKNEQSLQRGFGPVCWKKHQAEEKRKEQENTQMSFYDEQIEKIA